MPFRIRPDADFTEDFRDAAGSELRRAIATLEQQPDGAHEAIHDFRKNLKKVRSLYRLVAREVPDFQKQENARLRDTAQVAFRDPRRRRPDRYRGVFEGKGAQCGGGRSARPHRYDPRSTAGLDGRGRKRHRAETRGNGGYAERCSRGARGRRLQRLPQEECPHSWQRLAQNGAQGSRRN